MSTGSGTGVDRFAKVTLPGGKSQPFSQLRKRLLVAQMGKRKPVACQRNEKSKLLLENCKGKATVSPSKQFKLWPRNHSGTSRPPQQQNNKGACICNENL
jgi:hypothetical protein